MESIIVIRHRLPAVVRSIPNSALRRHGAFAIQSPIPASPTTPEPVVAPTPQSPTIQTATSSSSAQEIFDGNVTGGPPSEMPAVVYDEQNTARKKKSTSYTAKAEEQDSTTQFMQPTAPPRLKLPYHVSRTHVNNLPVYRETKAHGTLKLTLVRKISGDAHALKRDLIEILGVSPKDAAVVPPANYVKIKGNHDHKIQQHLQAQGF